MTECGACGSKNIEFTDHRMFNAGCKDCKHRWLVDEDNNFVGMEGLANEYIKRFKYLEKKHQERIRIINRNYYLTIGLLLFFGIGIPIIQALWAIIRSGS